MAGRSLAQKSYHRSFGTSCACELLHRLTSFVASHPPALLFSYKLLHINKGNSNFHNKINDIYSIIDIHKPDILSIQEANYDLKNPISIKGYNIEYKKLCSNDYKARTILLVKDNINYKRMYEYEDDYISSIWLEVLIKKRVSFFVMASY